LLKCPLDEIAAPEDGGKAFTHSRIYDSGNPFLFTFTDNLVPKLSSGIFNLGLELGLVW